MVKALDAGLIGDGTLSRDHLEGLQGSSCHLAWQGFIISDGSPQMAPLYTKRPFSVRSSYERDRIHQS